MDDCEFLARIVVVGAASVWLVLAALTLTGVGPGQVEAAYTHPDIVDFNSTTIFQHLHNSPTAWIVEFYSTWCPNCRQFAPTWRRLAALTKGWKRVIRIGAIDCGSNRAACRRYNVHLYPHVRLFPPGLEDGSQFMGVVVPRIVELDELQISEKMIDYVSEIRQKHNRPDFPFLGVTTGRDALSRQYLGRVMLFEDPSNPSQLSVDMGRRTIMEATKLFGVGAHRLKADDPVARAYGISSAPAVILCVNDTSCQILENESLPPPAVLDQLQSMVAELEMPVQQTEDASGEAEDRGITTEVQPSNNETVLYVGTNEIDTEEKPSPKADMKKPKKPPQRRVYLRDLDNAVGFALRHEVPVNTVLIGKRLVALKNFIVVLHKYYPGKPKTVDAFESMLHFINTLGASGGQAMTFLAWEAFLNYSDTKKDRFLPKEKEYVGCKGSSKQYRGFTCGLWMLFHTLLMEAHEEPGGDPRHVLRAVHGFVLNLFGCDYCRRHFDRMAHEDGLFHVVNKTEAVLWLWRAHNKVNARLRGDITEDPEFPKTQFPPPEMCPKCRKVNDGSHVGKSKRMAHPFAGRPAAYYTPAPEYEVAAADEERVDWDEVEVLDFLRWFYVLSDDPLVVNTRTNVSEEERAKAAARYPSLGARNKKLGSELTKPDGEHGRQERGEDGNSEKGGGASKGSSLSARWGKSVSFPESALLACLLSATTLLFGTYPS